MYLHIDSRSVPFQYERTPSGGMKVKARVSRIGVLNYFTEGKHARAARIPQEVFNKDSLATLAGAPVTVRHPTVNGGRVNPSNWSLLAKGHVGEDVKVDGDFIEATLFIQDEATMSAIEAGDLVELSCGYDAERDWTAGSWRGQNYDYVQRGVRYNHVALLPRGGGRAGKDVCLKLDSGEELQVAVSFDDGEYNTPMAVETEQTVTFDAKDFVPRSEFEALQAKYDLAVEALNKAKTHADSLEASVSPKALSELVTKRADLVLRAKEIAGADFVADGLTDAEIRLAAVKKASPDLNLDGKAEAYIESRFDGLVENKRAVAVAHRDAADVMAGQGRSEGKTQDKVVKAKTDFTNRMANMYQAPGAKKES